MAPREPKRSRLTDTRALQDPQVPLVVLDLASVETYLLCQSLTGLARESPEEASEAREQGEPAGAIWCPRVSDPAPLDLDRARAERVAKRIRLPLSWPKRHPAPVWKAMRVAALACGRGSGAAATYGLSRLAFAAAGDLDDPEEYLLVLSSAGLTPQEAALATKDGSAQEAELSSLADELGALGINGAPALRWDGQLHLGSRAIVPLLAHSLSTQPPLDLF